MQLTAVECVNYFNCYDFINYELADYRQLYTL